MQIIYDLKTQTVTLDIPQEEYLSLPVGALRQLNLLVSGSVKHFKENRITVKRVIKHIGGRK